MFWGNRVHGILNQAISVEKYANNCLLDIIRQYQAKQLYDEHKLTDLYIYRDSISKSFENQVLARFDAICENCDIVEADDVLQSKLRCGQSSSGHLS